jgi:predicted DNA-binding protein (MmcQ/YjbR family)
MSPERKKAETRVRDFALALPAAREDFPWGERVVKVGKKVFVFLGKEQARGDFGLSVKLPLSGAEALGFPFVEPCGYGLGRYGWVMARFAHGEQLSVEMLCRWIAESYRAVAPKKLVTQMEQAPPHPQFAVAGAQGDREAQCGVYNLEQIKSSRRCQAVKSAMKPAGIT